MKKKIIVGFSKFLFFYFYFPNRLSKHFREKRIYGFGNKLF